MLGLVVDVPSRGRSHSVAPQSDYADISYSIDSHEERGAWHPARCRPGVADRHRWVVYEDPTRARAVPTIPEANACLR